MGPVSPDSYWLRRVLALVGLFAVVGAIAWAASGFSRETRRANEVASAVGAQARPTVTVTVTVTPAPSDQCADGDIEVKLLADRETYPAGADPTFTVYVVNTSDSPCKRDVGSAALSLRVLSDGGLVWDSRHCADSPRSDVHRLQPGKEYSTTVTWDRTVSAPGCTGGDARVGAGTYQLVAAVGKVSGRDLTFYLE